MNYIKPINIKFMLIKSNIQVDETNAEFTNKIQFFNIPTLTNYKNSNQPISLLIS